MNVSLLDKSNYYRGLLVLIRRDRIIDHRERELMLHFGRILDFDARFCEAAIDDLLKNEYITDEAPVFSSREIGECFLRDAVKLAFVDAEIHPRELAWLKAVAQANGLTGQWLEAEIQRSHEKKGSLDRPESFNIQQYLDE